MSNMFYQFLNHLVYHPVNRNSHQQSHLQLFLFYVSKIQKEVRHLGLAPVIIRRLALLMHTSYTYVL